MTRRTHYEAQIKRFDTGRHDDFGTAIRALVWRHKLMWFTDEQIADIRDEMILRAISQRKSAARSRAHYAAQRAAS